MKFLGFLAFASMVFISACGSSAQREASAQKAVAAPPTSPAQTYRCESGQTISASYRPTDSATVLYKGMNYSMQIGVSGSGARYVGGGFEWWTKGSGAGSEGTLLRHKADGTSGEIIERCRAL